MSLFNAKPVRLILALPVLLVFSFLACGGKNDMKIKDVPVPPGASKVEIEGAEQEQFSNAVAASLMSIRERYKITDNDIYEAPRAATWQQTAAFYDERLKAKNFVRAQAEPLEFADAKILFWENNGFFGNQAVAVSFVEVGKNEDARRFIVVCTGRK